jgi:hypothetical protein
MHGEVGGFGTAFVVGQMARELEPGIFIYALIGSQGSKRDSLTRAPLQ